MIKKILLITFSIINLIFLVSCNNYKNISESKALKLGEDLFTDYFKNEVYSSGIDFYDDADYYSLYLTKDKKDYILKNLFSETKRNYLFSNNILTINDADDNLVEIIKISEKDFLDNYAGKLNLEMKSNNINIHTTKIEEYNYSKGSKKYYVLEQSIQFKESININVTILNANYDFFVNNVIFTIKDNVIDSMCFEGYQFKDSIKYKLKYYVYSI